jgi:hypothetical protein
MKRKFMFLGAVLAVVLLVGAASCTAADLKSFEGILQKVDSLSGNVTVTLTDNTTMTFNLKDIDLKALRNARGDAALEPGDNVTVGKNRNGEIKELKTRYVVIQGTIKSLGTENVTATTENTTVTANKMTVTTKDGDVTVLVTQKTVILGWGTKKPAFSDLKVGQKVVVKYDVSTMLALTITVNADGKIQDNRNDNGKDEGFKDKNGQNKNGKFENTRQNRTGSGA